MGATIGEAESHPTRFAARFFQSRLTCELAQRKGKIGGGGHWPRCQSGMVGASPYFTSTGLP